MCNIRPQEFFFLFFFFLYVGKFYISKMKEEIRIEEVCPNSLSEIVKCFIATFLYKVC